MNFLLDTNIVSEWMKPRPDPGIVDWLIHVDEDRVFISAATLAELRYGIERMPEGARRQRLDDWAKRDLPERFAGRVLLVDRAVADAWGRVVARSEARGRRMSAMDGFIAATAETHGLTLVTRNSRDFELSISRVFNPWRTH